MRLQILLGSLFMVWGGLLLGVSFLATPVKFLAPNLTLPVALEVGHVTFHSFNNVEWVVFALVALLVAATHTIPRLWALLAALLALLLAETFWLLPALDIRLFAVIAGEPAKPNHLHWFYIVAEAAKLLLVAFGGWKTLSMQIR